MPRPKPSAVPSAARYHPGARSRCVRVIAATPEGTRRRCRRRVSSARSGGRLLLILEPAVELVLLDDADVLAHGRVAQSAQLGADDLVPADAVRRDADLRGQAGHGVRLQPELGDPEGM